jgi:hypothetical protein
MVTAMRQSETSRRYFFEGESMSGVRRGASVGADARGQALRILNSSRTTKFFFFMNVFGRPYLIYLYDVIIYYSLGSKL